MSNRAIWSIAVLAAGWALAASDSVRAEVPARTTVEIVGSSQVFKYSVRLAEIYASRGGVKPTVLSTGSSGGVKLFCRGKGDGSPDMVGAIRRMKTKEFEACARNGVTRVDEVFLGYISSVQGDGGYAPFYYYVKSNARGRALDEILDLALAATRPGGAFRRLGLEPQWKLTRIRDAAALSAPPPPRKGPLQPIPEPRTPAPAPAPAPSTSAGPAQLELAFWDSVKDSEDPADFDAYLRRFPDGTFAGLAKVRRDRLIEDAAPRAQSVGPGPAPRLPPGATLGRRIALVIGNSRYGTSLGRLRNPVNDAELMAATLREVGFEVMLEPNLDFQGMREKLSAFGEKLRGAGPNAVALFYFSGHGIQARGVNYLAPIDAQITSEASAPVWGLSAEAVLAQMEESGSRVNLLVLDACRNNPFASSTRSASKGLAPMRAQSGTLIAYATRPGEVALDGDGSNSPFTQALARAVKTPGLEVELAFKQVAREVRASTRAAQTPWLEGVLFDPFKFNPQSP